MKNTIKYISILVFVFGVSLAFAQTPPPPNNNNGSSGGGNTPVGGGAPVGSGLAIVLAAAGAYGYTKWKNQTPDYKIEEYIIKPAFGPVFLCLH